MLVNSSRKILRLLSGQSARQGYLAAVDQGLISAANFLATIILARSVSPTELGIYGVGFTTLRLVRALQEGIAILPMNAYGPGMDRASFRRYATATSIFQIALALLTAGLAVLGGAILTRMGNDIAGPTLFSLWFPFLFWQLQEYIRRMLYTRGQVLDAVANTGLANLVRLVIMLVWAQQDKLSGIAGLDAIALGALVALLPGLWQTRHYWSRHFDNLRATWERNWRFGRYILGGTLAQWVSVEAYPILTAGMISFAAAGAYRALQNLVAPIQVILRAVETFLTPRAAKIHHDSGLPAVERSMRLTYLATGVPTLGLLAIAVLFPAQILYLFYGDTYLEYSNAVVLIALFYLLLFAYVPLQAVLKGLRYSQPIFIANLAAILVMFTIGLLFIRQWGVYGTLSGQILNALVVNILLWIAWGSIKTGTD